MKTPETPADEDERLASLRNLDILDTAQEERFDRLTRLAAYVAGTPIALVTLIDENRQWFKSRFGMETTETSRDISFCGHAIHEPTIFEVPDASQDVRFADNPLVTGDPNIRSYTGVPLTMSSEETVGTLCVIDREAKALTPEQKAALEDVSAAVVEELELTRTIDRARLQIQQDEQLRATMETVADGIISVTADGTVEQINTSVERLFGYSADELIGKNVSGLMLKPYVSQNDDYIERYLTELSSAVIGTARDATGLRKDGSEFPMHLSVSEMHYDGQTYFTVVVRDMTTEQAIRTELQSSLAFANTILDSASAAIIATTPEGVISVFNNAAEAMLGYSSDELVDCQSIAKLHDPHEMNERAREASEEFGRAVAPGVDVLTVRAAMGEIEYREWHYVGKRGERIPVEVGLSPLKGPSGSVDGYIAIAVDVSARRQAEKAKRAFVSTVSHEMRTPLTSVRGALGLLSSKFSESFPEKARSLLDNANRNSERLSLLINDILDIERLDAGRMEFSFESADLAQLVHTTISSNQTYADKYFVDIQLVEAPDTAQALIDIHRIEQVMSNLLSNAVKFSPVNTTVGVSIIDEGDTWKVSVFDKGKGIPAEYRDKIFQRFVQVDSSDTKEKGGTGLGLSICRSIIEQHSGTIECDSAEGEGTEFYFVLPKAEESETAERSSADNIEYPRILVCSSNNSVGDAISLLLNHNHFQGEQCAPEDAKRELSEGGYRALILDFSRGLNTDLDLLRNIRSDEAIADIPVIVISSQAKPPEMSATLKALNVYQWFQKPVDRDTLRQALLVSGKEFEEKRKILHVEDDVDVIQIVRGVTEELGTYDYALTLAEAQEKLQSEFYDLVLLDLGLPDGDGRDLLALVYPPTRVIVLSGEALDIPDEGEITGSLVKSQVTNQGLLDTLAEALRAGDDG